MKIQSVLARQLHVHRRFAVQFLGILVIAHGLFTLANSLLAQLMVRHGAHTSDIAIDIPLMIGISLVYLGTLLQRRKRTAWLVTVIVYGFYLGLGAASLLFSASSRQFDTHTIDFIRAIVLPAAIALMK